jgi:hypothetical protein
MVSLELTGMISTALLQDPLNLKALKLDLNYLELQ